MTASLGCARCGACCDPVKVDFGTWTRAVATARQYDPDELALTDSKTRDYWANAVFLASVCRPVGVDDDLVLLECGRYDREHQTCRAYEERPPLCRRYPWYGREPDGQIAELSCSYMLDVPPASRPEGARPLIPLTVVG